MPPVANRYGRRYHPFSRHLALQTLFPVERPICSLHSLYTIYPADSDTSSDRQPQPLWLPSKAAVSTAVEYFATLEKQHSGKTFEKPKGEVGHPTRNGYSLAVALQWPTEVYKEVQTKVHQIASEELAVATFGNQASDRLDAFYEKVYDTYPYLRNYTANWAVADFLRMYLRNKVKAAKPKST